MKEYRCDKCNKLLFKIAKIKEKDKLEIEILCTRCKKINKL